MHRSQRWTFAVSLSLAAAGAVALVGPAAGSAGAVTVAGVGGPATIGPPGPVVAWGDDAKGELGDGTTTSTMVPVQVHLPAGVTVRQVSVGNQFSLALTAAGRVLAWGDNRRGQLGNGTTASSGVPVSVRLPRGVKVIAIAAGNSHGLAVTAAGQVLAWGYNGFGELGNGTTASSDVPVRVRLPAGVRVTAVRAGEQDSLALTAAGQVLAWGRNDFGELGIGVRRDRLVPVPVKLPAGTTVTAISAGEFHSLAVTASGHVLAWGYNVFGQLGVAGGQEHALPVRAKLPAGTRVTAVSGGGEHSLALTASGQVWAWGLNDGGELCNPGGLQVNPRPAMVALPKGTRATAIAAGIFHTLIRTGSGHVLSCGNDQTIASDVPVMVNLGPGLIASALSQGPTAYHALAVVGAAG